MSQSKKGKWSGNKMIAARVPKDLRESFEAKCKRLDLSSADCLRLAIQEFTKEEVKRAD